MRGRTMRAALAAVTTAVAVLSACATPVGPPAASHTVDPCTTDPAITCDAAFGHIATPGSGALRGRLVLFFNGTGAQPLAYTKLLGALAGSGYHTIGVRYPSGVGTASACPDANAGTQPDCHRAFRAETVFGRGVPDPEGYAADSPAVNVSPANSVVNRVLQLVESLRVAYPSEGWGQFQRRNSAGCQVDPTYGECDLDWSKVVVMGHSLGAGVALYLSKLHRVSRVGMLSGPFDEYRDGATVTVAPWIAEGGFATGSAAMFGLSHTGEPNDEAQTAAWNALGMAGPRVSVDSGSAPWGGAQQLTTSITPACLTDVAGEHNSTAQNLCTPGDPPVLRTAWLTLAGG